MGSMRKSRLSKYKEGRLVEHFVAATTARTAASLCGVNRKTAALYFLRLREIIADELEAETADMLGGMPPVKWSAHWDMIVPLLGGLNDGWKARETRRYCAEASSS